MDRLAEKVAIVTGAGSGIGRATALAFAAEGAAVVIAEINPHTGTQVAEEIARLGGQAVFCPTDVRKMEDAQRMAATALDRWGRLNILVNNAGVAIPGSAVDMTEEAWNEVLNINLSGVWRGMKAAIPEMIRQGGGSIINVSSNQSLLGFHHWSGYAASKGGINSLTRQAAMDYAAQGIRVNAIAPGMILTPMNEAILKNAEDPERIIQSWNAAQPVGRVGRPEDIAMLAVFLASDESTFITGQVYVVDGGKMVRG
jgi:NAD(P)-dependent dehydrogenase (short-subunit alcohol dehydrogenase family)